MYPSVGHPAHVGDARPPSLSAAHTLAVFLDMCNACPKFVRRARFGSTCLHKFALDALNDNRGGEEEERERDDF